MMTTSAIPQWLQTATKKQKLRNNAIQTFLETHQAQLKSLHLNTLEDSVPRTMTISSVATIQEQMLSGTLTASQLCVAYIKQAIEAHRQTNWHVVLADAEEQAHELDRIFKITGDLVGPLHGVPMTLKDQFNIEGYDSTLGYVGRSFAPARQNCVLVSMLKRMGAVIIAKTNLPQSIMWCETDNPLWGVTVHPLNADFTPGGSTGGEGALLSLGGAVVGWGTDIGGSIRIPSHMNGIYGLKPSSTRLPYHGVAVSTEGQEHVPSVIGPMSQDIDSLIEVTKAVIDRAPWDLDPKCSPLSWRVDQFENSQFRPLVVAVMRDDGVVRPHPPVERVLNEVAAKLLEAGHEVLPWTPGSLHQECIEIMDQYYTADGGEDIRRDVEAGGEPYIPHVQAIVNKAEPISVYAYWQLNKQKLAAQKRFLELWNSTRSTKTEKQIDILLTPVMPHSAVPHRKCRWVGYTKVFNFVDYPAVVLPAGQVSKLLDAESARTMDSYRPRNPLDEWNWSLFDLDAMDGMPIGVQVVTRRLQEETALGAAKAIDEILKKPRRS